MLYDKRSKGVEVTFEGAKEVETVRAAAQEHNAYLVSLGNDSSVSDYQKTMAAWDGTERQYRGSSHRQLVEKLRYLHEVTEDRVDELLDETDNPDRITNSARRYELGARALALVEGIESQAAQNADLDSV